MNREFLDKMKEAKRMEAEALLLVLPENVRGHVEVIEKEMKAILMECMADCVQNRSKQPKECDNEKSTVQKVEIN